MEDDETLPEQVDEEPGLSGTAQPGTGLVVTADPDGNPGLSTLLESSDDDADGCLYWGATREVGRRFLLLP